jgi:hypothetical protein
MKNHKKMIALFVAFSFVALLHASTMPLRADQAPVQGGAEIEAAGEAPGFVEEEGSASSQPGKKSILPIVIGIVAVGAIAAVLVLVVLKTKYEIAGKWDFSFTSTSPAHTWVWTLIFSGDNKNGTFIDNFSDTGTYTVSGKDVTIEYNTWDIQFSGKFDGKDKMTGSATFAGLLIGGKDISSATWTATRLASGNAIRPGTTAARSSDGRRTVR